MNKPTPEPEPSPAELAMRAECERWHCAFGCGYDFFSQLDGLDPYGLSGAEWDVPAARFLAEMRKAWVRLGATFMRDWKPDGLFGWVLPFAQFCFGDDPEKPKRPRGSLEALRDAFGVIDVERAKEGVRTKSETARTGENGPLAIDQLKALWLAQSARTPNC